jgi:hypothetical protein
MPKIREFPISKGAPPGIMSFPNIAAAPPAEPQEGPGGAAASEAAPAEDVDDGFTPEERRKNQLDEAENFKKFKMMLRNRIPLIRIWDRVRKEGAADGFTVDDVNLFATPA